MLRRIKLPLLVILFAVSTALAGYLKSNFHELDQDSEQFIDYVIRRAYVVHRPVGWDGRRPLPVVLLFHGRGGFPGTVARQSQMNKLADKYKFLAVYPEGIGQPDNGSFNAGACCGEAVRANINDVSFTRVILDDLEKKFAVDTKRIYVTGMSNGASMAFRLAWEMADRITAIAPVSGNQGIRTNGMPQRPVPIVCFYGMKDPYMSYQAMWPSIQSWLRVNHCQSKPVRVVRKKDYVMERYEPSQGTAGAPVEFYKITEGGHTWPGGIDINLGPGAGLTVPNVSASELMWEFFRDQSL